MVGEQVSHITATGILDVMNSKLDILLNNVGWHTGVIETVSGAFTKGWITAVIILILVALCWGAIKRYTRCYFVAFNDFTATKLQRTLKLREYFFWAGVVAFCISVIGGLVAARVDKLLFG
jgi:hypothetical protein